MKRVYYWLFIIWWSAKKMFQINLGSKVIYQEKEYIVRNGVPRNQWKLAGLENDKEGYVRRIECKKVNTLANHIRSFRFHYSFYMHAWYDIWVQKGVKPWMRTCNIW